LRPRNSSKNPATTWRPGELSREYTAAHPQGKSGDFFAAGRTASANFYRRIFPAIFSCRHFGKTADRFCGGFRPRRPDTSGLLGQPFFLMLFFLAAASRPVFFKRKKTVLVALAAKKK
jgi:hypothetical protein